MEKEEIMRWEPITDRVVNSLWAEMSRTQRVNVQDIYRVIESDYVREFQPFEEYLKTHPQPLPVREGSEDPTDPPPTPPVREGSGLRAEAIIAPDNPTQAGGLPSITGGVGGGSVGVRGWVFKYSSNG